MCTRPFVVFHVFPNIIDYYGCLFQGLYISLRWLWIAPWSRLSMLSTSNSNDKTHNLPILGLFFLLLLQKASNFLNVGLFLGSLYKFWTLACWATVRAMKKTRHLSIWGLFFLLLLQKAPNCLILGSFWAHFTCTCWAPVRACARWLLPLISSICSSTDRDPLNWPFLNSSCNCFLMSSRAESTCPKWKSQDLLE